jgi:hypothetical protein
MVTSSTYRQGSQRTSELAAADPDHRLLSHRPLRRMEAEVIRDCLYFVAGELDETPFGPPDDVDVRGDGLVTVKRRGDRGRRSIYVLHRRTKLPTLLESFDSPQMGPNCVERGESIVAPQALHLLNSDTVYKLAGSFAQRVQREVGPDPQQQIARIHELAFGAPPDPDEKSEAMAALDRLRHQWTVALGEQPDVHEEAAGRALRNYCHAVMNSAGFIYVD